MSQLRKSARKKRQSQLVFTPLPSSSPAASEYNDQIARRAASVRYDGSSTKKQRLAAIDPSDPPLSPPFGSSQSSVSRQKIQVVVQTPPKGSPQLPTPVASSQVEEEEGGGRKPKY